ncbi:hypothetical protein DBV15_01828 [Temnothorax longispinosus]|uniref:Uncharacterized protein n=1 Tax=Temnothorax longispinosus TaxID=300112 RepID=A0A4S2KV09_9HYME|nr:hypothetical protein DBV15_01828 [Temnothorax longispinosus]
MSIADCVSNQSRPTQDKSLIVQNRAIDSTLTCPEPYFLSEGLYATPEELENTREVTLQVMTIGTFIEDATKLRSQGTPINFFRIFGKVLGHLICRGRKRPHIPLMGAEEECTITGLKYLYALYVMELFTLS